MNYLKNLLISIDQLGNVIAGGNPDNTISARIGYYSVKYTRTLPFQWKILKSIIDTSFYPIDGRDHCVEAYYNDAGEEFDEGTSNYAIAVLSVIIVISCVPISILLYTLYFLGLVSPKKINREKNIMYRIKLANAKLNGVYEEFNRHSISINAEIENLIKKSDNEVHKIIDLAKQTHQSKKNLNPPLP